MGHPPKQLVIGIPQASFDGKFYGRYPLGNKPQGAALAGGGVAAASTLGALNTAIKLSGLANLQASVAGDISTGATGSSGSTNLLQILKSITFTGGANGAGVTADGIAPYGSCTYSNAVVEGSDTTSMALNTSSGNTSFGYAYGIPAIESQCAHKGDTYWFSVRMYRPSGYSDAALTGPGLLKFFRIRTYPAGTHDNLGYDDIYLVNNASNSSGGVLGGYSFIYEGVPNWEQVATTNAYAPVTGVWETYDYMVTFDNVLISAGGKARIRFWKNKVLIADIVDRATLATATDFAQEFHHSTYWNGGATRTQSMYVNKVAMAAKIAGVRDDTQWLATDSSGNPLIAVGL